MPIKTITADDGTVTYKASSELAGPYLDDSYQSRAVLEADLHRAWAAQAQSVYRLVIELAVLLEHGGDENEDDIRAIVDERLTMVRSRLWALITEGPLTLTADAVDYGRARVGDEEFRLLAEDLVEVTESRAKKAETLAKAAFEAAKAEQLPMVKAWRRFEAEAGESSHIISHGMRDALLTKLGEWFTPPKLSLSLHDVPVLDPDEVHRRLVREARKLLRRRTAATAHVGKVRKEVAK